MMYSGLVLILVQSFNALKLEFCAKIFLDIFRTAAEEDNVKQELVSSDTVKNNYTEIPREVEFKC